MPISSSSCRSGCMTGLDPACLVFTISVVVNVFLHRGEKGVTRFLEDAIDVIRTAVVFAISLTAMFKAKSIV